MRAESRLFPDAPNCEMHSSMSKKTQQSLSNKVFPLAATCRLRGTAAAVQALSEHRKQTRTAPSRTLSCHTQHTTHSVDTTAVAENSRQHNGKKAPPTPANAATTKRGRVSHIAPPPSLYSRLSSKITQRKRTHQYGTGAAERSCSRPPPNTSTYLD